MSFDDFTALDAVPTLGIDFLGGVSGNYPKVRKRIGRTRKIRNVIRTRSNRDLGSDFLSYLNYDTSRKLNTTQGLGLNTNFFAYIGGSGTGRRRGGSRYARNALEVDYSNYINYGTRNAGGPVVTKRQSANYLSYIPLGSEYDNPNSRAAQHADPWAGIVGLTQSATAAEKTGVRLVHDADKLRKKVPATIRDQQILGEQGYESRYERWRNNRKINKIHQQRNSNPNMVWQIQGPMYQKQQQQPHQPQPPMHQKVSTNNPMSNQNNTNQSFNWFGISNPNQRVRVTLPKGSSNRVQRTPYQPPQKQPVQQPQSSQTITNAMQTGLTKLTDSKVIKPKPSNKVAGKTQETKNNGGVISFMVNTVKGKSKKEKSNDLGTYINEGQRENESPEGYVAYESTPEKEQQMDDFIAKDQARIARESEERERVKKNKPYTDPANTEILGWTGKIKQKLSRKKYKDSDFVEEEQTMTPEEKKAFKERMDNERSEWLAQKAEEERMENERVAEEERKRKLEEKKMEDEAMERAKEENSERHKNHSDTSKQPVHDNDVAARFGFHGYVNHPMHFLAGEAGRERVVITKPHNKRKHRDSTFDFTGGVGQVNDDVFDFHGIGIGLGKKGGKNKVFDFSEMGDFKI